MMAGDREKQGSTLGALGGCYIGLRKYAKAIDLYKMSLTLAEETGCLQSQCVARSNLFLCYEKLGQHDNAFKVYEQSRPLDGDEQRLMELFRRINVNGHEPPPESPSTISPELLGGGIMKLRVST